MATDGMSIPVFDSIVNGEQLTGVFRSAPFTLPKQFTFWMCGHNGEPGTNPQPVNHIRLRLVEEDGKLGETVAREVPPRNDVAREYRWDLARWSGKRGVIEIVDADAGAAYAWIGVGRFTPDVVSGPSEGMPNAATAQALAIRVSEQLQLGKLTPGIRSILHDRSAESATRIAALSALRTLEKESIAERCLTVVKDVEEPVGLRIAAAQMLGAAASKPAQEALIATLPGATQQLERALAMALTATPEGAERLLEAIEKGKATPRLLQDAGVNERLRTVQVRDRDLRLDAILAQLPPADEAIRKLVTQRVAAFPKAKPSIEAGAAIFKKSCVVCHRLGNDGAKVGPQLDGIGQRGHERLMEDILDPNRHIDGAFRATTLTTTNGLVVFGLKLREEGMVVVLADNQGKEVRIPKQEIEDSKLSPLSPMPGNFGEQLPESDLYNLMAFLLQQRSAPSAAP
jgi:putative heme-binding domain-containing protein